MRGPIGWLGNRHAGATRAERAALVRSRRARAHLERRQRRQQPRVAMRLARRPRSAAAAVLVTSLAAGIVLGQRLPLVDRVASVAVRGAERLSALEVAGATGVARGAQLASVDAAGVRERLREHPWIAEARALVLPTGGVVVQVAERHPAAVLAGPEPWSVDRTGTPFAPAEADAVADLPRLEVGGEVVRGAPDPTLAEAVALAHRLPELGLALPEAVGIAAEGDPEGLSLVVPGLRPRVVLGWEDLESRLTTLVRLIEADLSELSSASRLDLRFEGQAVFDGEPPPKGAAQAAVSRGGATPPVTTPAG